MFPLDFPENLRKPKVVFWGIKRKHWEEKC